MQSSMAWQRSVLWGRCTSAQRQFRHPQKQHEGDQQADAGGRKDRREGAAGQAGRGSTDRCGAMFGDGHGNAVGCPDCADGGDAES